MKGYISDRLLDTSSIIDHHLFGKLYPTGDLVKCIYNHEIDYLYIGRKDNEIKIRGQRVNIDSLEKKIQTQFKIQSTVCYSHNQLILAVQTSLDISAQIRIYCAENFPSYMVPSIISTFETLPLTRNGKIDHKKIISLVYSNSEKKIEHNDFDLDSLIISEIKNLLQELGYTINVHDDFFQDLGLTSLQLISILYKIREKIQMFRFIIKYFNSL